MNDHDFGGGWVTSDDLHNLILAMRGAPDTEISEGMTWTPLWQDRTGDAAPMRSHP
jgi:hypothetical protein